MLLSGTCYRSVLCMLPSSDTCYCPGTLDWKPPKTQLMFLLLQVSYQTILHSKSISSLTITDFFFSHQTDGSGMELPHLLAWHLSHFALIFLEHVLTRAVHTTPMTWPPYMQIFFAIISPQTASSLFSSHTLQSAPVEWSFCITTREKAVIRGAETGMCALWDVGKEGRKEELLTKQKEFHFSSHL